MLCLIEEDGQLYHAQREYDDATNEYKEAEIILDENNQPIPSSVCLCYAKAPSECCCACTSWSNYSYFDSTF